LLRQRSHVVPLLPGTKDAGNAIAKGKKTGARATTTAVDCIGVGGALARRLALSAQLAMAQSGSCVRNCTARFNCNICRMASS